MKPQKITLYNGIVKIYRIDEPRTKIWFSPTDKIIVMSYEKLIELYNKDPQPFNFVQPKFDKIKLLPSDV